jgi:hypothetical protein
MKKILPLMALLSCLTVGAQVAEEPPRTCVQIRDQIKMVTGLLSTPNVDLLQQIAVRQECNFTSVEVYRAAYGDKPLPPPEPQGAHHNRERDDD